MYSQDKSVVIVFNGEIYNYRALRSELKNRGHEFVTESDTEVLINGYVEFGIDGLVKRIEGMFAFAIYDVNKDQLHIARDKFGEKPLYYLNNDDSFMFASELKAFDSIVHPKQIDYFGLNLFLALSYIPAPFTIYKGINKLEPGTYLSLGLENKVIATKYYLLLDKVCESPLQSDLESCKSELRVLVSEAVKNRMMSDVPLGAFLSGGLDSSIVSTLMSKCTDEPINTFSLGFNEKEYDESERAQIVADKIGAKHTVHFLDYNDVASSVDDIISYFDEPFGDSSAIPTAYIAQIAKQTVSVVLTGDCADELFGGYDKYLAESYTKFFRSLPSSLQWLLRSCISLIPHTSVTNNILRKAKKVIANANLTDFDLHYNLMCLGFNDAERALLLNPATFVDITPPLRKIHDSYTSATPLEKGLFTDLNIVLEGDMLAKVDRMCMRHSLETRVPFLDSKVVEAAYRIPMNLKVKGRIKKHILREAFKDILPRETLAFGKRGFGVPVDYWLKNQINGELRRMIDPEFIAKQDIFKFEVLKKLYDEHMNGTENHKGKLWNIYVFQKWYRRVMM